MNRRRLIGGALGALATVKGRTSLLLLFPELREVRYIQPKVLAQSTNYELWGDFVLLPEGGAVPPIVTPAVNGAPVMCGASPDGLQPSIGTPSAVYTGAVSPQAAADDADLVLYEIPSPPVGLTFASAGIVRHDGGELFQAAINYEEVGSSGSYTSLKILNIADFAQPYPVWHASPDDLDPSASASAGVVQKVTFTPTPGLLVEDGHGGYDMMWVESGVLYRMSSCGNFFPTPQSLIAALGHVIPA